MRSEEREALLFAWLSLAEKDQVAFTDWHHRFHMRELVGKPGFRIGRRLKAIGGGPGYLVIYNVASIDVPESKPYLTVPGADVTPYPGGAFPATDRERLIAEPVVSATEAVGGYLFALQLTVTDASTLDAVAGFVKSLHGRAGVVGVFLGRLGASSSDIPTSTSYAVAVELTRLDGALAITASELADSVWTDLGASIKRTGALFQLEVCVTSGATTTSAQ